MWIGREADSEDEFKKTPEVCCNVFDVCLLMIWVLKNLLNCFGDGRKTGILKQWSHQLSDLIDIGFHVLQLKHCLVCFLSDIFHVLDAVDTEADVNSWNNIVRMECRVNPLGGDHLDNLYYLFLHIYLYQYDRHPLAWNLWWPLFENFRFFMQELLQFRCSLKCNWEGN